MDFNQKVYIVSGSSSGIGKACAEALLNKNAMVIGLDRNISDIDSENYRHYIVDLLKEDTIESIINEIDVKMGRIDGLANCAGVFANSKPFYELDTDEWERVLGTNLTSVFILSKYISQKMIKYKTGKIVNVSCIRSKIVRSNMADYAASKGGIDALTSAMALDLAKYKINVNAVAPGFTYTGMTKESFDNIEVRELSESLIPLGRLAKPEDIANTMMFLLSDLADYITGETIVVDGGYVISK